MWKDEIVEEIHKAREAYAAQFNYDISAMIRDAQARQEQSGLDFVTLPPKHPQEDTEDKAMLRVPIVGQGR